ncbi:unnamed protein product [Moneuplotes crassus]|uniref:DUSP domain-containing protein n=1 Tax=Euplotes crassus TaxID=5936 RepID=A0AAD1UAQ9_EUPCR|nr:unnamed protein product [Moneuplotes crassus]
MKKNIKNINFIRKSEIMLETVRNLRTKIDSGQVSHKKKQLHTFCMSKVSPRPRTVLQSVKSSIFKLISQLTKLSKKISQMDVDNIQILHSALKEAQNSLRCALGSGEKQIPTSCIKLDQKQTRKCLNKSEPEINNVWKHQSPNLKLLTDSDKKVNNTTLSRAYKDLNFSSFHNNRGKIESLASRNLRKHSKNEKHKGSCMKSLTRLNICQNKRYKTEFTSVNTPKVNNRRVPVTEKLFNLSSFKDKISKFSTTSPLISEKKKPESIKCSEKKRLLPKSLITKKAPLMQRAKSETTLQNAIQFTDVSTKSMCQKRHPYTRCECTTKGPKPCGVYCCYLSSEFQKKILFEKLRILDLEEDSLRENSKYAICIKWWYKWCDFVNISVDALQKFNTLPDTEEFDSQGSILQSLLHESSESEEIYSYEGHKLSLIEEEETYDKPSIINNRSLLSPDPDDDSRLKSYSTENYDYVLVTAYQWNFLKKWFLCDFEIEISRGFS